MSKGKNIKFGEARQVRQISSHFKAPGSMGDITKYLELVKALDEVDAESSGPIKEVFDKYQVPAGQAVKQTDEIFPDFMNDYTAALSQESSVPLERIQLYTSEELWAHIEGVKEITTADASIVMQLIVKDQ